MLTEAPRLPSPAAPGEPTPAAPRAAPTATTTTTDPALRLLLDDAARRARFFQGPARWLRDHAPAEAALLDAYADALARELAPPGAANAPPSRDATRPGWLTHGLAAGADGLATPPTPAEGAQEVRMAVAVVAAAASVVSAVAAVVTAVVAVTNAVSTTPSPPPPPKPK